MSENPREAKEMVNGLQRKINKFESHEKTE